MYYLIDKHSSFRSKNQNNKVDKNSLSEDKQASKSSFEVCITDKDGLIPSYVKVSSFSSVSIYDLRVLFLSRSEILSLYLRMCIVNFSHRAIFYRGIQTAIVHVRLANRPRN